MKQLAVEWLVEQLCIEGRKTLINQAKEIEKQQQGYSEEEVILLLQKYRFDLSSNKTSNLGDTTEQWLEKNK